MIQDTTRSPRSDGWFGQRSRPSLQMLCKRSHCPSVVNSSSRSMLPHLTHDYTLPWSLTSERSSLSLSSTPQLCPLHTVQCLRQSSSLSHLHLITPHSNLIIMLTGFLLRPHRRVQYILQVCPLDSQSCDLIVHARSIVLRAHRPAREKTSRQYFATIEVDGVSRRTQARTEDEGWDEHFSL